MNSRITIIAGGSSVRQDWSKPVQEQCLWDYLKNETTIACNYSYKYIDATAITFFDNDFYLKNKEELDKKELIIGRKHKKLTNKTGSNTYLLFGSGFGLEDQWKKGFYTSNLVGVFSLSLAIALGYKEIFLLGYDFCADSEGRTHFYEDDFSHRGIGFIQRQAGKRKGQLVYKTSNYNRDCKSDFQKFESFNRVKIYNVSEISKIPYFEKIKYEEYFRILKQHPSNALQSRERNDIEELILKNKS